MTLLPLCVCVAALIAGCGGIDLPAGLLAPYRLDVRIKCGNVTSSNTKVHFSFIMNGRELIPPNELLKAKPDRRGRLVIVQNLPVTELVYPGLTIRAMDCRGSGVPAAARNCHGQVDREYNFTLPTNVQGGTNLTGTFEFIEFCEMNRTEYRGFDVRQVLLPPP